MHMSADSPVGRTQTAAEDRAPAAAAEPDAHILVVDDRAEDLLAIRTVLDDPGYRIVTAQSGREALLQVLKQDFAVILLDAHMPGMDGFEVASIIKQRERSRHTPILFLTAGTTDMAAIYRAYQVGAIDYLTKPVDKDVVRAKVGIFVDLYRKDQRILEQAEALRAAERRQRELELIQERIASTRRYRNLAEAIPQIVFTIDPAGEITYVNQRWTQYTGQPADQVAGWGWSQHLHPEEAEEFLARMQASFRDGTPLEAEVRLRRHDGEYRWHRASATAEHDERGVVTGWIGTCTDIDDLKRLYKEAQTAIHVRDEFLSIASHELRTPLTALQLQLETLRDALRELDHDGIGKRLAKAEKQTGRLGKLIANLLDVSRIVSGTLQLEIEEFDVAEAVKEVADRFAEEAARAGCTLDIAATSGVIRWDRVRLEQVVTNLLSNAIKYAPGSPIEIRVDGGPPATLTVQDHGIGIAPEDLTRIFGRFERAAPTRHYGGLGMGLFIAQQIVEAHGGSIAAASRPGEGARFTVELPPAPPRDEGTSA
jgi:PAS domain S-box-containing protein